MKQAGVIDANEALPRGGLQGRDGKASGEL